MRRQARSRRAVSRVLRRSDPDAKRRVTRLGRRPRPSRLNAGAARKRLRRRDDTSAAPKRGARDQGVARGARRTPSFGGPALLPDLPSRDPAGRAGNRSRPALPLGSSPRASLDDAPPMPRAARPRERRRTPSRHQRRHAMTVKLQATADALDTSRLDAALDTQEEDEEWRSWWTQLPDFIKPDYPLDIPPNRMPFVRYVFTAVGAPRFCPQLRPGRDLPGRRRPALLPRRPEGSLAGSVPVVDDDLRQRDRRGVRAVDARHGQPLRAQAASASPARRAGSHRKRRLADAARRPA